MYSVTGIIMYKQDRCSTKAIKLLATFHNTSKIGKIMKGGLKLIRKILLLVMLLVFFTSVNSNMKMAKVVLHLFIYVLDNLPDILNIIFRTVSIFNVTE